MSITTTHPAQPPQQPATGAQNAPLLIAVPDAAHLLGIGTTLAWDLVRAGEIPSVKLGRRVLVPRAALEHLAHSPLLAATNPESGNGHDIQHPPVPTPGWNTVGS